MLHLIEGLRNADGGPVVSLRNLVKYTSEGLAHSVLYQDSDSEVIDSFPASVDVRMFGARRIHEELENADVVHLHGMWSVRQALIARKAYKLGVPYVLSPRGMLEPWSLSQSRFKKRLFLSTMGNELMRQASQLHATADLEAAHLPGFIPRERISVIPNVVEGLRTSESPEATPGIRALFLSRIHKKKGLFDLIPAWSELAASGKHTLTICGPGSPEAIAELQSALKRVPKCLTVNYLGPAFGEEKAKQMGLANVFLLPSYSENYGNVVPEALSAGLPVLSTTGMPWRWLADAGCGWTIEPGVESVRTFLKILFQIPQEDMKHMSRTAKEVFEGKLEPRILAHHYLKLYERCAGSC